MLGWRQFLPQDKVASFAQLRPGELLLETERAIGDASLHALHLDLIQSRADLRRLEMARGRVSIISSMSVHRWHVLPMLPWRMPQIRV